MGAEGHPNRSLRRTARRTTWGSASRLAWGGPGAGVRRRPARGGPAGGRWGGGPDELRRLATESDCLVIAAPHTAGTAGVVDRRVLGRLPQHAVVVNVSRGTLLDEAALL